MKLEKSNSFDGFVVVDDHVVVGAVHCSQCLSPMGPVFYAHSFWSHGPKAVAAMLWQAARREARRLGFKSVDFYVSPDMPALMQLVESKKATVKQIWVEVKA